MTENSRSPEQGQHKEKWEPMELIYSGNVVETVLGDGNANGKISYSAGDPGIYPKIPYGQWKKMQQ